MSRMKSLKSSPKNMAEIADMLGVTAVSVSNALRNSPLVSKELRDRVNQIVKETGFKPRVYKQREKKPAAAVQSTVGRIAVLDNAISSRWDPVAHVIMKSVMKRLTALEVPFEVIECKDLYDRPEHIKNFSGVVFYYALSSDHLDVIKGMPQVAILHEEIGIGSWDVYKPNEVLVGRLAAEYLLDQGYKNLLLTWWHHVDYKDKTHPRLESFRAAITEAGMKVDGISYDSEADSSIYTSKIKEWLDRTKGTGGIFAFCDRVAYRLCTVLDVLGYKRQAGKLEVVSCDNTYLSQKLQPPIAVVDSHIAEIAERAVDGLLWRLANPHASRQEVTLQPDLVLPDDTPLDDLL